jgi:uncharacterized protein
MNQKALCKKLFRKVTPVVILLLVLSLQACLIDALGGHFNQDIKKSKLNLSPQARALIGKAYEGTDQEKLMDYHVHIVGMNTGKTGCFVNPRMFERLNIKENTRFRLFMSALGIKNMENADEEALERLVRLIRDTGKAGRFIILPLDRNYNKDGTPNINKTTFFVPNEYVYKIYQANPDIFMPAISIHPYRKDAIQELERWAAKGVRIVKWIPNAQGINPADPDIIPYYRKMKELNMVLLSHGGHENAVDASEDQKLGNPLLLRLPLDMGVKVIVAHGASLGKGLDIDHPERGMVNNFDLFLRLMDEKKYKGLVFGDISAQLQFNRLSAPLKKILERPDLHRRLVNGSDYPLPAMNLIIMTSKLSRLGFITAKERKALNEIYRYDPLLFDFVLKRTVRHPKTKDRFSVDVFHANAALAYK